MGGVSVCLHLSFNAHNLPLSSNCIVMATKKIVKPRGQEPDEWDTKVASELMNLEVGGGGEGEERKRMRVGVGEICSIARK